MPGVIQDASTQATRKCCSLQLACSFIRKRIAYCAPRAHTPLVAPIVVVVVVVVVQISDSAVLASRIDQEHGPTNGERHLLSESSTPLVLVRVN